VASLIADMTEKLEGLFLEFQRYDRDWYTDATYQDHAGRIRTRVQEVLSWSPEERESFTEQCLKERDDYERINTAIYEQFNRLNQDTFPQDDPEAPVEMLALLHRVSQAYRYKKAKKGASFVAVMLYLYACGIDHASWYGATWLKCALATGHWTLAETILKALGEEKGVRGQFAKDPEQRMWRPLGRSVILLNRDQDVAGALEYADHAKRNCAEQKLPVDYFHAVKQLQQDIETKELGTTHINARGLLTGSFNGDQEPGTPDEGATDGADQQQREEPATA
jgi:hypothetical protein